MLCNYGRTAGSIGEQNSQGRRVVHYGNEAVGRSRVQISITIVDSVQSDAVPTHSRAFAGHPAQNLDNDATGVIQPSGAHSPSNVESARY